MSSTLISFSGSTMIVVAATLFLSSSSWSPMMTTVQAFSSTGPPFDQCDSKESYYATLLAQSSDPSQWSKSDISALITETHRTVLPNVAATTDELDILDALRALWPGQNSSNATEEMVHVIYRDIDFPSNIANTQLGWEREDLWPRYRGWDLPDDEEIWTDVHSKAPADATVRTRKKGLFFGLCGTVEHADACFQPATSETAATTETDGKIWAPPDRYKGDVARALFYTAARYHASLNLTLVDCPPFAPYDFGYLTELLKWHEQDPVSDEEMTRNDVACADWQGNRNPFVDYPTELVPLFYPDGPDTIVTSTLTYSRCTAPTPSPTATRVACNDLEAGDVPIFLLNSQEPDQVVMFPLVDIPVGVEYLYLTDSPWDGQKFLNTEGTMQFKIPAEGLPAGVVFGLGGDSPLASEWTQMSDKGNAFDVQTSGDNLFVYCLDGDDLPNFLFGFSNNGPWLDSGLTADDYGSRHSALPAPLALAGSVFLSPGDNCVYVGPLSRTMEKEALQETMINPEYFDCINNTRFQLASQGQGTPSDATTISTTAAMIATTATTMVGGFLLTTLVWVMGM